MLTQVLKQPLHSSLETQKFGQISVPAVSGAAEVDEAKAATMARATAEVTRNTRESCVIGSNN